MRGVFADAYGLTARQRVELAPRAEAWLREAAPAISARLGRPS